MTVSHNLRRPLASLSSCLLLLTLLSPVAPAQETPEPDVSMRELIEVNQESEKLLQEVSESEVKGARVESTPMRAMAKLDRALKKKDFQAAADALDLRFLPEEMKEYSGEQLLRALRHIFGQQNVVGLGALSDEPEGDLEDGLPSYRDQLGEVTLVNETIPIYLQRIPDGKGGRVWKISNATVERIPEMWEELGPGPLALYLARVLPDFRFMGLDNWQLILTVLFLLIAWPLASLASNILLRIALAIYDRFPIATTNFFRRPLRFFLFVLIARQLMDQLGLSMKARILLQSSGVDYIAYTVLLLGLLSFIRDYQIRKMQRAGNIQYVALLKPFTTILKVIVITIIGLFWAESAGYNMSTVLAGLGVGSLAIALAAQRTLENVIGAVTLYTARPVRAGDFCRFGNVTGTVEEIGLRSTTIRTLDRSLVVIPNAVFSSTEIENFTARDRIRYFRRYRVGLAGADQLRRILDDVRDLFKAQPDVIEDSVSVRFESIEDGTAWLRLDAGVNTTDYQAFLAVAEELNLGVVEAVENAGATLTGPATTIHRADDSGRHGTAAQRDGLAVAPAGDALEAPASPAPGRA